MIYGTFANILQDFFYIIAKIKDRQTLNLYKCFIEFAAYHQIIIKEINQSFVVISNLILSSPIKRQFRKPNQNLSHMQTKDWQRSKRSATR